jgi:hypothetical protein
MFYWIYYSHFLVQKIYLTYVFGIDSSVGRQHGSFDLNATSQCSALNNS